MRTTEFIKIGMSKHEMLYYKFWVHAGKGTNGTRRLVVFRLNMLEEMAAIIVVDDAFEMSWTNGTTSQWV